MAVARLTGRPVPKVVCLAGAEGVKYALYEAEAYLGDPAELMHDKPIQPRFFRTVEQAVEWGLRMGYVYVDITDVDIRLVLP